MENKTKKLEREQKPTSVIIREKRYSFGNKEIHEKIERNQYDSCGYIVRSDYEHLISEFPIRLDSRQRHFKSTLFCNWSKNRKTCDRESVTLSIAGIKKKDNFKCKLIFDEQGRDIESRHYLKEKGNWVFAESTKFFYEDGKQIHSYLDKNGNLSFSTLIEYNSNGKVIRRSEIYDRNKWENIHEYMYDSENRLVRVIGLKKDKPEIVQSVEYPREGSKKITIYPCGSNVDMASFLVCYDNKNVWECRSFYPDKCKPIYNARYVETQREKQGKDKEGRDYRATLTQGWLEDIASEKRIERTNFSKIEIKK